MEDQHDPKDIPECSNPEIADYITDYCFGGLPEDKRDILEAHLLECNACWEVVQKLDRAVQVLRNMRLPGKNNGH